MSKFFTLFFVALISFGLTAHDADAKRFGGGSSIGKQRTTTSQQTATPPKPASSSGRVGSRRPARLDVHGWRFGWRHG